MSDNDILDVVIVGAGLSGIGAAWHLKTLSPDRSFAIIEAREAMGGTWDLFRYPGVRSDSDMHTLGYRFKPWTDAAAIADGPSILRYVRETAREHGIDHYIRYRHRLVAADWSSEDATWTLEIDRAGEPTRLKCRFLFLCAGYYDYARGHAPAFADADRFGGAIVHPQFWPGDLDHAGKRIVVIGSGATAVTLVPELARTAAHVTMLQRSPTYIVSRPREDRVANALRRVLPPRAAYRVTRWKNVLLGQLFYRHARKRPARVKRQLLKWVAQQVRDGHYVGRHFTPDYNPWDQRLCLVPDGDLFAALRDGRADIVTDRIERFSHNGVMLASGGELPADIIVTATGLEIRLLGGATLSVDGRAIDPAQCFAYKGMMLSGVPNMALSFGYTNASWTLKADLTAAYVCRLLKEMQRRRVAQATPIAAPGEVEPAPFLDFTSGYVQRAAGRLPQQGRRAPWRLRQSYLHDLLALRYGRVDDAMVFTNPV